MRLFQLLIANLHRSGTPTPPADEEDFGLFTSSDTDHEYTQTELSTRVVYHLGRWAPMLLTYDGKTYLATMDRESGTYDSLAKIISVDHTTGDVDGPYLMGTPADFERHLIPALLKMDDHWLAFQEDDHNTGLNIYKSATLDIASEWTFDQKIGTVDAYPKVYNDGTTYAVVVRRNMDILAAWVSADGVTWTDRPITAAGAQSFRYSFQPNNPTVNGWSYISFDDTSSGTDLALSKFLLKTQDWITFYNFQETFSKNVVSSGVITNLELTTNCRYFNPGSGNQSGLNSADLISTNGNFYSILRDGSNDADGFRFNYYAGGWQGINFTFTDHDLPFGGTNLINNPFQWLFKTATHYYFGVLQTVTDHNEIHLFRTTDFVSFEDMGSLFSSAVSVDFVFFPFNIHELSVGDSFYVFAAETPTLPESAANQGTAYYKKFTLNEAFGEYDDITFVAVGAAASGTTSATPGNPTVENGDLLLMDCSSKLQTHHVTTPTAYRRLAEGDLVASTASNGGDVGPIRQTVFMKETDGTEDATETVDLPSGNSINAAIYAFRKDPDAEWQILVSGGAHNTPNLTAYEAISFHKMASKVGDVYVVFTSINTDLYAFTDQALAQTGNTFETVNQDVGEFATTEGNDSEQFASIFRVTAVTDPAPLKLTFTATSNGSAAGNPIGVTHFVRLRQVADVEVLPPSGLRVWRASEIVQTTYSGDGSSIWDGQRVNFQTTGTTAEKYAIETFNSRACFKYQTDLIDSSNFTMRSEVSKPIPWQPAWPIGTQQIHEYRFETPADAPDVYLEWDFLQNHAGTAAGGPWPLNSPIYYFAFAHAGQTGWTNTGDAAVGGEMAIVLKTASPDVRHLVTGFDWAPSTVYRVRHHVKHDYASGDPCLKVWVSINGGAFSLVYENYTDKTVWEDADIATDGSPADVGGAIKTGIYDHMITNGTAAANAVTAGHTGYVLYSPCEKIIIQHPSDPDYITDVTDNDNPIYAYVSTENE